VQKSDITGAWLAGTVPPRRTLNTLFERVIASLHQRLDAETDDNLARSVRFPTQHFDLHRDQLTLTQ
jgi:hypothetical protein